MNTYTFATVNSRVKTQLNNSGFSSVSSSEVYLYLNTVLNTITFRTPYLKYNIDPSADTIIINSTTYSPGSQTSAAMYDLLTGLFPDANSGSGGSGLNGDGTYTPDGTAHYISTASSLKNADSLLDAQVFSNTGAIATNTSSISSNTTAIGNNTTAIATNTSAISTNASTITATNTRTALFLGSMTSTARDAVSSPTVGSYIFNTTTGMYETYEDTIWTWMPMGWQQQGINKYHIDAARSFYTANSDTYFITGVVNSASFTSGALTGSTSEVAPSLIFNTNALSNGRAFITTGNGTIVFGSGLTMLETRLLIPTLSNGTDRFVVFSGFNGSTTSNDMDNGMGILYDEGGNSTGSAASANFQLVTAVNSVRTFSTTSIAVVANTWYRLKVLIAADGTWVRYYINDTLVNAGGTDVTTNIPTTYVRSTRMNIFISKVLGTTSRTLYVNTVRFRQKYTTPRA